MTKWTSFIAVEERDQTSTKKSVLAIDDLLTTENVDELKDVGWKIHKKETEQEMVIADAATEVSELLHEVSDKLDRMKKAKNLDRSAKNEGISLMKNRMERAKRALKHMKIEIRDLPREDQTPLKNKAAELEKSINDITSEIQIEQGDTPAGMQLVRLSTVKDDKLLTYLIDTAQDYKELLAMGNEIQKNDIKAIASITRIIESTQEIGTNTLTKMSMKQISTDTGKLFPSFCLLNLLFYLEIPQETIEEIREAFKLFDRDGDGTITTKEISTLMASLGEKITDEEIQGNYIIL